MSHVCFECFVCLHENFHRPAVAGAIALDNTLPEDRQVYIGPSGGPYMGYLVKKKGFLDLSDNYIFLAFRKAFRKLFLELSEILLPWRQP